MLKVGVQVQQATEGRVKVNEWKTVIEPTPLDELKLDRLRGLEVYKARLIFEMNGKKSVDEFLTELFRYGQQERSTDLDPILNNLAVLFGE